MRADTQGVSIKGERETSMKTRMQPTMCDREELAARARQFYAAFNGVLEAAGSLVTGERSGEYGPPESNFIHGDESYLEMVWVKVSRLCNLVEVKRNSLAEYGWEGWSDFDRGRLADSLIDLINYSAFWAADILLDGQWPAKLTIQPRLAPALPPAAMLQQANPWPEGQEPVRCPMCGGESSGFFGRKDGRWFLGCVDCGYTRASYQAGSLFLWYAERYKRGLGATEGDVEAAPTPTPTQPTPHETGPSSEAEDAPQPQQVAAAVKRRRRRPTKPEIDPSEPPQVSDTTPAMTIDCVCGEKAGVYVIDHEGRRQLQYRCGACEFLKGQVLPDMMVVKRVIEMERTERIMRAKAAEAAAAMSPSEYEAIVAEATRGGGASGGGRSPRPDRPGRGRPCAAARGT